MLRGTTLSENGFYAAMGRSPLFISNRFSFAKGKFSRNVVIGVLPWQRLP
jgi:hypothetical protein